MMKVRGPKSAWMSSFLQYLQQFWTSAHEASTRLLRPLILPAGCRSAIPDQLGRERRGFHAGDRKGQPEASDCSNAR